MDESSLRAQLATLEASRSSLHSSFRRWEWIVVAGIILELVVLVKEYWDGWRAHHRATIRLPEKPNTLLFGLGVLGVSMVASGISKELGIDSQIEKVETQIRGVNEQLFGIVSKEAEDASQKSSLADIKAGTAQRKADAAEASVRRTGKLAALAEIDAQTARQDAVQLRADLKTTAQELTDEHSRRMEFEKTVAPRLIPIVTLPPQHLSTADVLRKFAGVHVIVESIPDWEARRAASNIVGLLTQAGWIIDGHAAVEKDFPDGVSIKVHWAVFDEEALHAGRGGWPEEQENSPDAGDELIAFLRANDWVAQTDFEEKRQLKPNQLYVKVGYKPAPYFTSAAYPSPPLMPREKQRIEEIRRILKSFWAEQEKVLNERKH